MPLSPVKDGRTELARHANDGDAREGGSDL